jgi:mannan endo-1,4-beta-mannosidase
MQTMKRIAMAGAAVAALVLSLLVVAAPQAQAQQGGFSISGRNLIDANGNNFIMRGTSHPDVWFSGERGSYAEIAGLGANAVRVVLGSGQRGWGTSSAADVTTVINLCKQNRLICMLEVHDTTGFGEQAGAATLDQAVTYWNSIRTALIGQEAFILINIGNEPIGNNNPAQWTTATVSAVQRMRTLGFTHTLVVDAPNWGQDWTNTMRTNAQTIWNADAQRNTLFSVHMYEVYGTASAITTYFDAFQQMGLPLIVGEFGHMHNGQNVDEDTIMAQAQQRGIGWLAWSYSGNGGGVEFLDQTTGFNPNSLTTWGQRVFNGPNGMTATAQCATVYTGCGPGGNDDPPPAPAGLTATTTSTSISLTWNASAGATQYQIRRAPGTSGGTFTQVGTSTGTAFTNSGLANNTTFRYQVTASNANGTSPPSSTVTATTGGGGTGGGCSAVSTVQNQWGNGYVVQPVTVTNAGTSATTGWSVSFTLPAGHSIAGSWNAQLTPSSGSITATNMGYNGALQPNGSTTFGFQVSRPNGDTQTPTGFTCTAS